MKKYLLVAASVLAVATSSAHATDSLSGAYAGVRLGSASTKVEMKYNNGDKVSFGAQGFTGDVVAGFGQLMDSVYLGGEVSVGLDGTNEDLTKYATAFGGYTGLKLKEKMTMGAAARLGYALTQKAMIYASLGLDFTQHQITAVQTNGTSVSVKKRPVAFVPGIGTQIAMTDNIAVRADFNYTVSNKIRLNQGTANELALTPKKAAFKVGLVMTF